ncbi:MAG: hypothetical protein WAM39_08300, partial [Bryobacteraceae bacterium]
MHLLHIGRALLCFGFALLSSVASAQSQSDSAKQTKSGSCLKDDTGLILPPGFCATVFADGIGHARHLVVSPSGVLYVDTWSGTYYRHDVPPAGGFLVALQDKNGARKADVIERFGETAQSRGDGGKRVGVCANKIAPAASLPAHWAPNAMVHYDKKQFPARYRNGVFIAFHGSWDRAPYPQG